MSKQRSPRQLKKLHRRWLWAGILEACRSRYWRSQLLSASPEQVFCIDSGHLTDLPTATVSAVRRYRLQFSVAQAPASEAASWLSRDGYVLFKFWATDFPSVRCFTGNNPQPL